MISLCVAFEFQSTPPPKKPTNQVLYKKVPDKKPQKTLEVAAASQGADQNQQAQGIL